MIRVNVKKNDNNECIGFHLEGHAKFDKTGKDIVCAAVSALAINCMNSIEEFTEANFHVTLDEKKGMIDLVLTDNVIPENAYMLLLSFFHGVSGIERDYGSNYVKLTNE